MEERETTMCANCGATFEVTQAACPYCGAIYEPGAEHAYMEEMEDIREELAGVPEDARRKSTKFLYKIVDFLRKMGNNRVM